MSFGPQDRFSIFGALRPAEGQFVTRAVVATYSLDLIALLGLALALGGDGEAEFENSPLGLVQAFDSVRGRLLVLHQLGRVIAPKAHRSVLPLLDTMVHAIPSNERHASWHPKLALVRYEAEAAVQWRFWIGSRNLTGAADFDAGLLLVTSNDRQAKAIPDVAKLAQEFLIEAAFSPEHLAELRTTRWLAPTGVSVRSLLWRRPGQMRPFIQASLLSRGESASAVSPFVDPKGLSAVLKAGSAAVSVLTTEAAASACPPVAGIKFRTGTPPEPEASVSIKQQRQEAVGEFNEPPPTGLHAKLLAITKGDRAALVLGSANLTARGLDGPNGEAGAILDIEGGTLAQSLTEFVAAGCEYDGAKPDPEVVARERAKRELDEWISLLLESSLALNYASDGLFLVVPQDADKALSGARFDAAPFLDPDSWQVLTPGVRLVKLLNRSPPLSEQTSLVTCRATSLADQTTTRTWLLSLPVAGLDQKRRDQALLVRYVGASRFREWLRARLNGIDATAGQHWTDPPQQRGERDVSSRAGEFFTLETMLAAWARDPLGFERRVAGLMEMLRSFEEAFATLPDAEERDAALNDLAEVRPFLEAVHNAIHGVS